MNKKGFTLVELLVACSLFLLACSFFALTLKSNKQFLKKAQKINQERMALQNSIEAARQTPVDLELVQIKIADNIYILRSKYQ